MKRKTAEHLMTMATDLGRQIDESLAIVKREENETTFKKYRATTAQIMGTLLLELINPIAEEHPDLKPERLK